MFFLVGKSLFILHHSVLCLALDVYNLMKIMASYGNVSFHRSVVKIITMTKLVLDKHLLQPLFFVIGVSQKRSLRKQNKAFILDMVLGMPLDVCEYGSYQIDVPQNKCV